MESYLISAFRNIPYASAKRFEYARDPKALLQYLKCPTEGKNLRSLKKPWTIDTPIVDHTPHFPQPDEFNKSNWKTLPRVIKENQEIGSTNYNLLLISY